MKRRSLPALWFRRVFPFNASRFPPTLAPRGKAEVANKADRNVQASAHGLRCPGRSLGPLSAKRRTTYVELARTTPSPAHKGDVAGGAAQIGGGKLLQGERGSLLLLGAFLAPAVFQFILLMSTLGTGLAVLMFRFSL